MTNNDDKNTLSMTPIFSASGTTILGVKLNRPLTIIAKKKFLQHCQNEAAIILSSILIGYLQWRENNHSYVHMLAPIETNNTEYKDDNKRRSQQQLVRQLIERLRLFQQFNSPKKQKTKAIPSDKLIHLPEQARQHPNSFFGFLFDHKTKTSSHYIGEQPYMVTSELNSLLPKRWRPLFMHNHNAPWGWPLNDESLNQPSPQGFGPFLPVTSAKQQIFGIVYGSCLCFHYKQAQSQSSNLDVYEWPTKALNIESHTPSWCLGSALYLSAIGYMCPSINLSPTPSWIAPRGSLIPLVRGLNQNILQDTADSHSSAFELFKFHMHNWMVSGLQTLNKKQHRKRLKSVSRTAKGKMIIPLMLKKLHTGIDHQSMTPQLNAALLFEDALTLPYDLSYLLHQVIGKLKV